MLSLMDYVKGDDRHQLQFNCLEDLVSQESWARVVDLFVDVLPIKELGFKNTQLNTQGREPFDPSDLLKVYLYCYKFGIRSSYKIHHQLTCNAELWWLLKNLKPSVRTLQYFRHNNAKAIKKAFRYFGQLLLEWELIGGEVIAIDSFKIRAQNSLKNNYNQKKINQHYDYIDNKIEEYFEDIREADTRKDQEEIVGKIAYQMGRKEFYSNIENTLKETDQSQISTTDTDAKAVILHRNVVNVGYNIQATADGKHKLLIDADTGNVNDTHDLYPMARRAKTITKSSSFIVLADKGYHTGAQLEACQKIGIQTFVAPKESSSSKTNPKFAVDKFLYLSHDDSYTLDALS